jgi:DNA primase
MINQYPKGSRIPDEQRNRLVKRAADILWSDSGKDALEYLTVKRSLSEKALRDFQVGFVPLGANNKRLEGRIIFPVYDSYNNLIAISTRHLYEERVFWHESFEKHFHLYGIQVAKQHILKNKKAIVVEGEMDVLAMHGKNIRTAVGVCGSSLSIYQISVLARYCNEIYLLFDADKGGDQALARSKKIYDLYLDGTISIIPCKLPRGYDPDKFLLEHSEKELVNILKEEKSKRIKI